MVAFPSTASRFAEMILGVGDERSVALVDPRTDEVVTYSDLRARIRRRAEQLAGERDIVLLAGRRTVEGVVDHLAAMLAGHVVLAFDGQAGDTAARLMEAYSPAWVLGASVPESASYRRTSTGDLRRTTVLDSTPAEGLCLMLSTSGSTGNPKCVLLSAAGLYDNTHGIAEVLRITESDRAITALPFFYGYGLSVLHSHLLAGASLLLDDRSVVERGFWTGVAAHQPTSLPGVPSIFHLLRRLRFDPGAHASLRKFTQSGALLDAATAVEFARRGQANGTELYLMYGQTESSARISTLPPEQVLDAPVSGGYPLPRTRVTLTEPFDGEQGQLRYFSRSVMWGYASTRADTTRGDTLNGVLDTGDLARLDERGRIWITGRLKRIAKVHGLRISLDDIERLLEDIGPVAALPADDRVLVAHVCAENDLVTATLGRVAERLGLRPRDVVGQLMPQLPTTAVGKTDYLSLAEALNTEDAR